MQGGNIVLFYFTTITWQLKMFAQKKKHEESIKYQVQLMHEYMCGPGQSVPLVLVV